MPKGKNGKSVEHTTPRSLAFKVIDDGSNSIQLLVEDAREKNLYAAAIHRVLALFMGICDPQRAEQEVEWLREKAPEFYRGFLATLEAYKGQEYLLHDMAYFIATFGARAKDAFYAFALPGKKSDSLIKKGEKLLDTITGFYKTKEGTETWVKGSLEKSREAYEKLCEECKEKGFPAPPPDKISQELIKEKAVIKRAMFWIRALEQGEKSGSSKRPLAWVKELMDARFDSDFSQLIYDAAAQRLLGYMETAKTYRKGVYEFSVAEFLTIHENSDYKTFCEFISKHPEAMQEIQKIRKRYERWKFYPQLASFGWTVSVPAAELSELSREELLKVPEIALFDRNLKLYLKFRKGVGKPTGLTFIDFNEHPYNFTIPGERTRKGQYEFLRVPCRNQTGAVRIKLSTGTFVQVQLSGRELDSEVFEKRNKGNSTFLYLYRVSLGRNEANSTLFEAALGGLRVRWKKGELFLDLTINLITPELPFVPWNKEEKHFDLKSGTVLAAVAFGINGEIYVRKMEVLSDGTLRHLKTMPVELVSQQYRNLAAIQISSSDGTLRRASKKEFKRLLDLLMSNSDLDDPQLLEVINARLSQKGLAIDQEALLLLKEHLRKRNDRSSKQNDRLECHHSGSLGRLLEFHWTILKLKRELEHITEKVDQLRDAGEDSELSALVAKRRDVTKRLKQMRQHQLNARDMRVRSFSHEIARIVLASDQKHGGCAASILVLPQIKDMDPTRRASRSRWSEMDNTLLLAGRSAEICEWVKDLMGLFGIPTLRISTNRAAEVCPSCGELGLLFWKKEGEISFKQNRERKKGEALPLPILPNLGCPNKDCGKELHTLHVIAGEMIRRVHAGIAIRKSTLTPGEARKAFLVRW